MGYTHYWEILSTADWQRVWPQLVSDARLIVGAAKVPLCGMDEDEMPEISESRIYLNGRFKGHENFVLEPSAKEWTFCKTARKEYDVVVAAILLRASFLAGEAIEISSDGDWNEDQWQPARKLVGKLWPMDVIECPWTYPCPLAGCGEKMALGHGDISFPNPVDHLKTHLSKSKGAKSCTIDDLESALYADNSCHGKNRTWMMEDLRKLFSEWRACELEGKDAEMTVEE